MKHFIIFCMLCFCILCIAAAGCNTNTHGVTMVTGIVTFNGLPLEGATVTFHPSDGNLAAAGLTSGDGTFTLNSGSSKGGTGAQPGTYLVSVTKTKAEGGETVIGPGGLTTSTPPRFVSLVPIQYANAKTSGFQAVVEQGKKNHFTFDLKASH